MNDSKTKIFAAAAVLCVLGTFGTVLIYRTAFAGQATVRKQVIGFPGAKPSALPFSTAIKCGNMLFLSGVIGTDLETGELVSPDVDGQTHQCLKKLKTVLKEAGMDLSHAVRATVYLVDIEDYNQMNQAYGEHFKDTVPPARACVQVAKLVKGAKVEISMIAME